MAKIGGENMKSSDKSISDYNKQHSKLLKAMNAEGMKPGIDFASIQRRNAEKGFVKSTNGMIPSLGQSAQTKGFFKKIG